MRKAIGIGVCVGLAAFAIAPGAFAQSTTGRPSGSAPVKSASTQAKAAPAKRSGPATVRRPPPPPAAALPEPIDTRIQAGCLGESALHEVALPGGASLPGLEQVVAKAPEWGPPAPCLPYLAALTDQVSTLVVLQPDRLGDRPEVLVLTREPGRELIVARREALAPLESAHREVRLAARELESQPSEVKSSLPGHLLWELEHLLRALASQAPTAEAHHARLVLEAPTPGARERIAALALIESNSLRVVDGVVWQPRGDSPGAYVSLSGADYERVLWSSPVKHERISRGVGPGSATVTRRVTRAAQDGGKPEVVNRRVRYVGHHIGIDYVAPRGTPINAVADATVVFAGTKPGYGRMVILDHGAGYQTYYAHLTAFTKGLKAGSRLARGEVLGQVGSTGISTGPHLHYEIRKHGEYINVFDVESRLSFWNLAYEEHPAFLARVMSLDLSREASAAEVPPAVADARPLSSF